MNTETSSIIIYTTPDGTTQLNVKLENETVWLTVEQIATLFDKDRTVISRHIRNIYKSKEIEEDGTCAKFAHMGITGLQQYSPMHYNLDVILSVGYRTNSKKAVVFRRWASSVLKQYLIKGYAINQQRLDHYNDLKEVVRLMSRAITLQEKVTDEEYSGLFNVVSDYVYALDTLDHYDYQSLGIEKTTEVQSFHATYENAMELATFSKMSDIN